MMILLIGLGLLMVALYFFAEVLTLDEVWDKCWYGAKFVLALTASFGCIVASR